MHDAEVGGAGRERGRLSSHHPIISSPQPPPVSLGDGEGVPPSFFNSVSILLALAWSLVMYGKPYGGILRE